MSKLQHNTISRRSFLKASALTVGGTLLAACAAPAAAPAGDSGGDAGLEWFRQGGYAIVYHDLLVRLQKRPDILVSFTRGGRTYEKVGASDLADDTAELLHPEWFRKWFHFQPAALERPEPCNV